MKNILVICSIGSIAVGCTTTRVDDHSYHYSSGVLLAAPNTKRSPAATTINNYKTETVNNINNVTHNYRSKQTPSVYQQDQEYLQFQQTDPIPKTQENISPMGYRGLHILEDRNGNSVVIPARRYNYTNNPIPGHGIPVFKCL